MRKGRRHLSHLAEPGHMQQFGLQVLQAALARAALGQVPHKPGELAAAVQQDLAHL